MSGAENSCECELLQRGRARQHQPKQIEKNMSIEKQIHRKAADYVAALQDPAAPELEADATAAHVHIRTTLRRKSAWVQAAKPRKLADWIIETLDREANE